MCGESRKHTTANKPFLMPDPPCALISKASIYSAITETIYHWQVLKLTGVKEHISWIVLGEHTRMAVELGWPLKNFVNKRKNFKPKMLLL